MKLADACPLTSAGVLARAAIVAAEVEAVVAGSERVTYAELAGEVARIRSALVAAGISRGDRVALCLGNEPRWVALFLALGSLGAVVVPVNTRLRSGEIERTLRQSRSKVLFVADRLLKIDFIAMLRAACPAVDAALPDPGLPDLETIVVVGDDVPAAAISWPAFLDGSREDVPPLCEPDDVLLMQYTSGTTAFPKGVLLTHRSMCGNAFFSGARLGLRVGDRLHSARPFFHVAGTTLSILAALQHGTTLVTMERFTADEAVRLLEAERCTHFSGNDTMALMLLDAARGGARLHLRGAWLAASRAVVDRVIDELGAHEAVVGYGLSEASPNVAQSSWWEPREVRAAGLMRPQPGVEVRIRSIGADRDAEPGEVGEILVRGWNVMRGYFELPAETAAVLSSDGWLATGDLGSLDDDGRLAFCGRLKDIIRVGGENVAPAEVEDVLHTHRKIRQAVVVAVPDARLQEVPFAFVWLRRGLTADAVEIIGWARERMAGFKVPRHVEFVDDFDRLGMTASAKVRRRELADHARRLLERR